MEEEDFSKLSVEDACAHKVWKARLQGYTEAKKIFGEIEDEKSADWNKFVSLVKKFVVDSHALCQEKGLEAALVFVENSAFAGRTTGDVVSGIIQKALAAPKARTKELGAQVILMYIEIEKQDVVLEELLKGTDSKNPKVTAACVHVLKESLKEFGPKVININKVLKKVTPLIEDRDQYVRQETKGIITEVYHWLGPAIKPQLALSLKPNQLTEIECEYEKVKDVPARASRLLRSQQVREAAVTGGDNVDAGDGDTSGVSSGAVEETDPYDLLDPIDILSQLNKEFYTKLESKKWVERKEVVEELDKLLQVSPKLENADYGDLLRALKKVVQKDSNIVVVGFAIKCITGLAKGLKKKFHQYAGSIMPVLFEKFKEKKQNVVTSLREAVDTVYISTTLEALQEDVIASLENKNPSIKAEVSSFLTRCFTKSTPSILTKKLLKVLCKGLTTLLSDGDPTVRDNSAMAIGTAMKVVGEKTMAPFLVDIDATLQKKVKEYCDKAEVVVVRQAPSKPVKAPVKNGPEESEPAVVRPKSVRTAKPVKSATPKTSVTVIKATEAKTMVKKVIPADVYEDISSLDVEKQNAACERLMELIPTIAVDDTTGQLLLSLFATHDFSKANSDLILRLNLLKMIAEKCRLPRDKIDEIFYGISKHLTNPSYSAYVDEALTVFANRTSLTAVAKAILPEDKNFKDTEEEINLWADKLNWICSCIKNVDILYEPGFLNGLGKRACECPNSLVSNAGVKLIGFVHIKLDSQKDQEKVSEPTSVSVPKSHSASPLQEREMPPPPQVVSEKPADVPKVDLGPKLTEALLSELADKNWKVRSEAVDKIRNMITSAESITSNLGDAAPIIAARMQDSNGKISANAIALVQSLAPAMGPSCKRHISVFLPALMKAIGDQKTWIRTAVINCFNVWGDICGYDKFFEGELIADALKSGTPAVRAELWSWLSLKLPDIPPKSFPKDELTACLSTLFSNLEDRNADVRKNALEATLGVMLHLGYNNMVQALENIKGSGTSARVIKDILDKTRGSLPVQPLQKSKSGSIDKSGRSSVAKMAPGSSATIVKKPRASVAPTKPVQSSRQSKKEEEDDQPLLQINNLKHQRVIDEQKMKVLKWTFTSVRPEFVDLLREQMITANVNKTLLNYMFHPDFRFHLRAIESLNEDLPTNRAGLKSNLDLILRWMTLKFYDTNPSVLLKGLEYLNIVFTSLIEDDYSMLDSEAAAFIPSLIIKAGDPKDAVRNSVRVILKQIASVYPASKQFSYLMDGLKSKNSRQRSECLDQLCWLIETYGVTVFHPSMPAALKEIAKQIADRDNAVRNSALNCVVQAYYLEGERVYKMVGQISDKDMSLLEERIKRASKNRPLNVVKPFVEPPIISEPSVEPLAPADVTVTLEEHVQEVIPPESIVQQVKPLPVSTPSFTRPSSGAYGFDRTVVADIECTTSKFQAPKLVDIDLQFLKDSSTETSFKPIQMSKMTPTISSFSQPSAIKRELVNIASGDIDKAMSAIHKIDTIIISEKRHHLNGHVDHFVSQLSHLIVILNQSAHPEVVNCYNATFATIIRVCSMKEFCSQISEATLYKILEQFLLLLTEPRLDNKQNMFGRAVNNIVIRFLENSNKTNLMCALLKILYSCVNNPKATNHFKDLLVKCLWKLNKSQPEWDSELDYARILSEFHTFLKDYPTSWWKNEEFDFPLRTVKTILHSMVKIRGTEVREIAEKMPNVSKDSELYIYIKKVIKHLKVDEAHKGDSASREASKENIVHPPKEHHSAPVRLTKEEQDELSDIFRMIGDFDVTAQGMKRLYAYLKNHPEANVEPFLSKTNPQFQNYIRKGLQALEEQHSETPHINKNEIATSVPSENSNHGVKESEFTEEAGMVWNKLKNMQEISGYQCDENKEEISERLKDPLTSGGQTSSDAAHSDIASLIARVEKIKSSKRLDQK